MTWTTPQIDSHNCGMEVTMYESADDEIVIFNIDDAGADVAVSRVTEGENDGE